MKDDEIVWELPDGYDGTWVKAPPEIEMILREELDDGSYRDLILVKKNNIEEQE